MENSQKIQMPVITRLGMDFRRRLLIREGILFVLMSLSVKRLGIFLIRR